MRDQRDRGEGGPPSVVVSHGLAVRGKGGPPGGDESIGVAESRDRTMKAKQRPQQLSHHSDVLVLVFLVTREVMLELLYTH